MKNKKINFRNNIRLTSAIFFVFAVFLFPSLVFGEETLGNNAALNIETNQLPKNLPNLKINPPSSVEVIEKDGMIKVSAEIVNNDNWYIPEVGYRVWLLKENDKAGDLLVVTREGQKFYSLVDENIQPAVFSLAPQQTKQFNIEYHYPQGLPSGKYFLQISPFLNSGVGGYYGIGSQRFGVEIKSNITKQFALDIDITSCFFIKSSDVKIQAGFGALYAKDQALIAQCSVTNTTNQSISAKGIAPIRFYQGSFSNKEVGNFEEAFTFGPGEKKTIELSFPPQSNSGAYQVAFKLFSQSGDQLSGIETFKWTIKGDSAKVSAVYLDKDYYNKDETAKVVIAYTGPADLYWRSRPLADPTINAEADTTLLKDYDISAQIKSGNNLCGQIKQHIDQFNYSDNNDSELQFLSLAVPVASNCVNPSVVLSIEKSGQVLSQLKSNIVSQNVPPELTPVPINNNVQPSSNLTKTILMIVAILILAILILFLIFKGILKKKIFIFLAIPIVVSGLFYSFTAQAAQTIEIQSVGNSSTIPYSPYGSYSNSTSNVFLYPVGSPGPTEIDYTLYLDDIGCNNGAYDNIREQGQIFDHINGTALGPEKTDKTTWMTSGCHAYGLALTQYDYATTYSPLAPGIYALKVQTQHKPYTTGGLTACSSSWAGLTDHWIEFKIDQDFSVSLSALPTSFDSGNNTNLTWSTGGTTPDSCTASGGDWSGSKTTSGSGSYGSTLVPGSYAYSLSCTKTYSWGMFSKDIVHSIDAPVTVISVPIIPPIINPTLIFYASPDSIVTGGSSMSTLYWGTINATSCAVPAGKTNWLGASSVTSGSQSVGPFPSIGNFLYYLECKNSAGTSTGIKTATVSVSVFPNCTASLFGSSSVAFGNTTTLAWNSIPESASCSLTEDGINVNLYSESWYYANAEDEIDDVRTYYKINPITVPVNGAIGTRNYSLTCNAPGYNQGSATKTLTVDTTTTTTSTIAPPTTTAVSWGSGWVEVKP